MDFLDKEVDNARDQQRREQKRMEKLEERKRLQKQKENYNRILSHKKHRTRSSSSTSDNLISVSFATSATNNSTLSVATYPIQVISLLYSDPEEDKRLYILCYHQIN